MAIRQSKDSKLFVIGSPYAWGEVPGVQTFGYNPQRTLQRRGTSTFSGDGPVAITDNFEGVTGQFEIVGVEGEKAVLAYASRQDLGAFVSHHSSVNMPVFIVANSYDDKGDHQPLGGDFIDTAKIGALARGVQTGNAQFPFEALNYREVFDKEIVIQEFAGAASPVTELTLSGTAAALKDKAGNDVYALLVLKQKLGEPKVKRLHRALAAAPGYYTEDSDTVTLAAGNGLAADEKALVVWVKDSFF